MIERRFSRQPFARHPQPRSRRVGIRTSERIERRYRSRQIAASERGLGGAHGLFGPALRRTIDAADRHQAAQPGESLRPPIGLASRPARRDDLPGQVRQALHQNRTARHSVSSGFGERLGGSAKVGPPSEPDECIEFGRERPRLLERFAHLLEQQRQYPAGPQIGAALRLPLALERRSPDPRDRRRPCLGGRAPAGYCARPQPRSPPVRRMRPIGFRSRQAAARSAAHCPSRGDSAFELVIRIGCGIEVIDAARQRTERRVDRIGIGARRRRVLRQFGEPGVERGLDLVDTARQCARRRSDRVDIVAGRNGTRLDRSHPRGERLVFRAVLAPRKKRRDLRRPERRQGNSGEDQDQYTRQPYRRARRSARRFRGKSLGWPRRFELQASSSARQAPRFLPDPVRSPVPTSCRCPYSIWHSIWRISPRIRSSASSKAG